MGCCPSKDVLASFSSSASSSAGGGGGALGISLQRDGIAADNTSLLASSGSNSDGFCGCGESHHIIHTCDGVETLHSREEDDCDFEGTDSTGWSDEDEIDGKDNTDPGWSDDEDEDIKNVEAMKKTLPSSMNGKSNPPPHFSLHPTPKGPPFFLKYVLISSKPSSFHPRPSEPDFIQEGGAFASIDGSSSPPHATTRWLQACKVQFHIITLCK